METWVRKACRQRAYRQFITWIAVTIAAIAGSSANQTYWNNFFHGPFQLSEAYLAGPTDYERQFVSITGTKVVDSGIQETTTETTNGVKGTPYVSSKYWVLVVGDKFLIVKQGQQPPLTVKGEFADYPADLPTTIFPDAADTDLRKKIYPRMLDVGDDYRIPGYVVFGVAMVWCFLLWKFALPAYRQIQQITLHPVVRRVEGWNDSIEAVHDAEQQMTRAIRFKRIGIIITDDYVVVRRFYSFDLLPYNHLVWAYKKVTTRTLYFVVPIAQNSECIFVFYGGHASFPSRKKLVEEVLLYSAQRAPWALFGYTKELAHAFKHDQAGFTATVEARRERFQVG